MLRTCLCTYNNYNMHSYVAMVSGAYLVRILHFEARTRRNVPKPYILLYPTIWSYMENNKEIDYLTLCLIILIVHEKNIHETN